MPTVIDCPSCGRKLRVADELVAARVKCPTCGTDFAAPQPAASESRPEPADGIAASVRCPYCGEQVDARADSCRHCGELLDEAEVPPWGRGHGVRRDCEAHRGGLILALGVAGVIAAGLGYCIVIGLPLSVAAWVLGHGDLRRMRAGEMDPEGESTTRAGRVCGIIGTALSLFWLAVAVLYLAAGTF